MRTPVFVSKLFVRAFSVILAVVILFSVSIYLFATRIVDDTVDRIEDASSQTILNSVYEVVSEMAREQERFEQSILEEKRRNLRTAVDMAESYVRIKLKDVREKRATLPQAKARILDVMRDFRFGNNDYVWIADYNSFLISHPLPELNGKDASGLVDINGQPIVSPMVEKAQAYGDGFYTYLWHRLDRSQISQKLTYFRNFPELQIVLGAGFYIDDLDEELKKRKREMLNRLRSQLLSMKIANTGYLYIFDGNNQMIIHPNDNIEGKDASSFIEPVTKLPITGILKRAADSSEGVNYKWDKPDDPGNFVYDKISWVRYFPKYDWYIATSVYTDEMRSGSKTIGRRIMQVSLMFLLISTAFAYLFVRNLTKPIVNLSKTAKKVRGGDLSIVSDIRRNDEIGDLALAFNAMVERLRDDIEQLDARVASRTAELEAANRQLKELDQMKSDFMTSISHEFRTPLTSIRGFLAIIRREFSKHFAPLAGDDEKLQRKRQTIEKDIGVIELESVRLTHLFDEVLDFTALISGQATWSDSVFPVKELLEEAADACRARLKDKPGVEMILACPPDLPDLTCDRARFFQVLDGLLENAANFTDEGFVRLEAAFEHPNILKVSVSDSGIGIAPSQQDRIFKQFHQVLNQDTLVDKPKGTGLGLSICKLIVEHYHGAIRLSSREGQGSRFDIDLPVCVEG